MIYGSNSLERHIVFICDDNYVMPTFVVINSINKNIKKSNYLYIVHICTFGLSKKNKEFLENQNLENLKIEVNVLDEEIYKEKFSKINQSTHVTPTALIKFDLYNIFPNYDELLYLDSDIIVKKDIGELFDIDISNFYLAASFEFWKYLLAYYKSFLKEIDVPFYFNSGVLFLNCKKMRQHNISDKLWKVKFEKFNSLQNKQKLMDQDSFNDICASMCYHLPVKFNFNCQFMKNCNIDLLNEVFHTNYNSFNETLEDAVIVHYVGKTDKPWKFLNGNCVSLWESYYIAAGYSLSELSRVKFRKGLAYYFERLKLSLRERGFWATVKYFILRGKK